VAIVNEIKCARCDRKYSGVRSRCPYCGARRIGRGKYTEDSDNAKGKMMISVLILAVFTVAAGILLFTTPVDADANDPGDNLTLTNPDDDIEQQHSLQPTPTPQPPPTPEIVEPDLIDITSISVTVAGMSKSSGDEFSVQRGENLGVRVTIEPVGITLADDFAITFDSTDDNIFTIVEIPMGQEGVYGATLTGTASERSSATLTIKVVNNDKEIEWTNLVRWRR